MSVAFLVDGVTEQRFVQLICPKAAVKRINLNGASVQTDALAKRISSLIRLWNGKYRSIVVLVDLEKREQAAGDFSRDLLGAIEAQGAAHGVIVGVADRMLENWMLGDIELWPDHEIPDTVDGFAGATFLKKLTNSRYDKAAHGPDLLKNARASEIRKRSPSFASLCDQMPKLKCYWLNR